MTNIMPDKMENRDVKAYYRPCDLSPGYSDLWQMLG